MSQLREFLLEEAKLRPLRIVLLLHLNGRARTDACSLLLKCNNLPRRTTARRSSNFVTGHLNRGFTPASFFST